MEPRDDSRSLIQHLGDHELAAHADESATEIRLIGLLFSPHSSGKKMEEGKGEKRRENERKENLN